MTGIRMTARAGSISGAGAAVIVGLVICLSLANPAAAAWVKSTTGAGAAKAGTPSVTNVLVARTKCQGSNHTLTVTWNVPSDLDAATTVTIYRGTATNPSTSVATQVALGGTYTDNGASSSGNNFYKVELKYSANWVASGQANTASC